MASAIFILDQKGKPLIFRKYRDDCPSDVPQKFMKLLEETEDSPNPVIESDNLSYLYLKHINLYILVVTKQNSNAAALFMFMYRFVDLLKDYFQTVEEESVRDNFVIIYELLDEIMDFGYPQITDGKVLQEYITTASNRLEPEQPMLVPGAVTGAVSWRPEGIKYRKNEVFLDVVESVNLIIGSNGTPVHSEIVGNVQMKVQLTGMPELKLGLNDKILFETQGRQAKGRTVELEDIKFHQCVRLARFEADRQINFVPPDGEFTLMSYRLDTKVKPLFLIETQMEVHSHSRVEITVKAKSQFKARSTANNVQIEVPADVAAPTFRTSIGSAEYVPKMDALVWNIKQFSGNKEYVCRAHFALPSITTTESERKPPIRVKFEIPYFTVSGIQVRYLKIIERSGYTALPWVRYITKSGDYQIRLA